MSYCRLFSEYASPTLIPVPTQLLELQALAPTERRDEYAILSRLVRAGLSGGLANTERETVGANWGVILADAETGCST